MLEQATGSYGTALLTNEAMIVDTAGQLGTLTRSEPGGRWRHCKTAAPAAEPEGSSDVPKSMALRGG